MLDAPDVRPIDLPDRGALAATGRAYWSPSRGLVFTASNLPAPPRASVSAVGDPAWQQDPVSAGMLDLDLNGCVMTIGEASTTIPVGAVAVSLEPAGGVPAPTGQIYLVGSL